MNNSNENEMTKNPGNGKTYEYVFHYFSEQILEGKLKINDKIPPEREICEQLGVSRNSIREVMHMLEINGLIECVQGSGNYVRCDPREYMLKSVHMVMSLMEIQYTEVFHIRTGFELVALKLAMQEATEEELEGIHEALINMARSDDPKESGMWDARFHNRILQASHNRLLILYASMISDLINDFIKDFHERIMSSTEKYDALMRSHWTIYEALVNKDYSSGSLAMNKHFEIVAERLNDIS